MTTQQPEEHVEPFPPELAQAFAELDGVSAYADIIEVETPSEVAFDNARRLLKSLYRIAPRRYEVSPEAGGRIFIEARDQQNNVVSVACASDGVVECYAGLTWDDPRRAHYGSAHRLPDAFIHAALVELDADDFEEPFPSELAEAFAELDDIPAYAAEIEVETPSEVAIDNARRLLKSLYRIAPRRYSVYPTTGGGIAIDARGPKGYIMVLECESDGGALCVVSTYRESHRRARYASTRRLPDAFVREALADLERADARDEPA